MNGGPIITFPLLMTRADFFIRAPVRGLLVIVQVRHCLHRCHSKDRLWVELTGIFRADAGADTPIETELRISVLRRGCETHEEAVVPTFSLLLILLFR
jgi:hypothetical protein